MRRFQNSELFLMRRRERLERIAAIIEAVGYRCAASDGPVPPTLEEMTQDDLSAIYALAIGRNP